MAKRSVTVASRVGLHARPAAVFVRAATATAVPVTISKRDGPAVSASSMLAVLTLAVGHGDEVVLHAEGPGAEDVLEELAALLSRELDSGA